MYMYTYIIHIVILAVDVAGIHHLISNNDNSDVNKESRTQIEQAKSMSCEVMSSASTYISPRPSLKAVPLDTMAIWAGVEVFQGMR